MNASKKPLELALDAIADPATEPHIDLHPDGEASSPLTPIPALQPVPRDDEQSSPSHLSSVVLLNAAWVDPGGSPNRLEASFESEEFFLLVESILHNRGNVQPIAVRELSPDEIAPGSPYRYRLISGARRLRACAMHGISVLAIIHKTEPTRDLIDRLVENHLRENLSPYELGAQLQHIIQSSSKTSRRELARLVGLDVSIVQKAIDIAALPRSVISAFSSASEIQYRDAKPLKDAVGAAHDAVIACAETLKGQTIPSKEIVAQLVAAAEAALAQKDGKPGVEPFNTPGQSTNISVEEQVLGTITMDKKGMPEIHLGMTLSPGQQADLAVQIEKFLANRVLKPRTRRSAARRASEEGKDAANNPDAGNDDEFAAKGRAR